MMGPTTGSLTLRGTVDSHHLGRQPLPERMSAPGGGPWMAQTLLLRECWWTPLEARSCLGRWRVCSSLGPSILCTMIALHRSTWGSVATGLP